ncbi:type II secretion system protein, partial [bacterium]|nr:type II secretion system protein [bacterium]
MKKRGFTLAEVLIALTLVGVIAAMTMPSVVTNSKAKTNVAKLASTVSALENAFATMMISEAVQDITETEFGKDPKNVDFKLLDKYLKIASSNDKNPVITLKNGIDIYVVKLGEDDSASESTEEEEESRHPGALMRIDIDSNGEGNKPNAYGVDIFRFAIGNNGTLYPAGGDIYEKMYPTADETGSCTATIVKNGYTIK